VGVPNHRRKMGKKRALKVQRLTGRCGARDKESVHSKTKKSGSTNLIKKKSEKKDKRTHRRLKPPLPHMKPRT